MAKELGTFEQAVLLGIVRLGDNAYGRAVLREVQGRLRRAVAAGAVYATLDRLEGQGLIASALGTGTPVRQGRPRRYYRVESAGVRALNESKEAVEHLWQGLRWPLEAFA